MVEWHNEEFIVYTYRYTEKIFLLKYKCKNLLKIPVAYILLS